MKLGYIFIFTAFDLCSDFEHADFIKANGKFTRAAGEYPHIQTYILDLAK